MDTFESVAAAKAASASPEEIQQLVSLLRKESAHGKACDRALLRRVAHQLADLCKQGEYGWRVGGMARINFCPLSLQQRIS